MILRSLDLSHHQNTGARPRVASTDFAKVKEAGAVFVVIRTNYGMRTDDLVIEHNKRADSVSLPRMFYWYPLSRKNPTEQADLAFQLSGGVRGRRGCLDVEENADADGAEPVFPKFSEALWNHVNTGLVTCDNLTGLSTIVYSSQTKLDSWFTLEQQLRWADRFGWWAHYNQNISMPWIPKGWSNKARKYEMWQDKIAPWPGCLEPVDQNRLWEGLTVEELLGISSPPVVPPVSKPALVGLHGRADGRMQPADFDTVRQAKIEAVKVMATAAPEDVDTLKSIKSDMLIMVRLFADFRGRVINPSDFARDSGMGQFYLRGVRLFEIHNEPNLKDEGWKSSWNNGTEFGTWFSDVKNRLRQSFPDAKFGFPGISPGAGVPDVRMDEREFLNGATTAAMGADWIGLHVYFNDEQSLSEAMSGKAVKEYSQRFPNKPIYITEFSNSTQVSKSIKGQQYVKFYQSTKAVAAFSFVVSASQGFVSEVWRTEGGTQSEITAIVGNRSTIIPPKPVTFPQIIRGSKLGIHSFKPNKAIQFVKDAVAKGVTYSVVKAIADAGVAQDVKKISPNTITITRFVDTEEDSAQDVDKWTDAEMVLRAKKSLAFALGNSVRQAQLRDATDYIEVSNEADPPGVKGYAAFGRYLCEMVRQANSLGIKIAIPAFNSGTPEFDEMQAFASTGLFGLMKAGGHILTTHEGSVRNTPVDKGFGDTIPGAPVVTGAGSICFRYRFLYHILKQRDEVVPLVISEFYSGDYNIPVADQVKRFEWVDRECRKDHYVLSVLPFTIDSSPTEWQDQNYTNVYPTLLNYLVSEKNIPNATKGETAMDEITRLALIDDWKQVQVKATHSLDILNKLGAHVWKVGDIAVVKVLPLTTYVAPNGAVKDVRPNAAYDLNVSEVTADQLWLKVSTLPLWVKVADVKLKGT